jgi:TonB family protein
MKTRILLLMLLVSSFVAMGQNQEKLKGYDVTPPKFTGVEYVAPVIAEQQTPNVINYLKTQITYPESAARVMAQGTVVVGFTVTAQGKISGINIINSVNRQIDDEVIAAVQKTSGMWKPGFINGEPCEMEREISLVFKIGDMNGNDFTSSARKYYTKACEQLLVEHNCSKALRNFDKGIVLLPNDKSLLVLRGLTRYESGDKTGALRDWKRIESLGGLEGSEYLEKFFSMKGYEPMAQLLLGENKVE